MHGTFFYLTHPQVQIDPDIPVPDWGLSETGRGRAALAAQLPALQAVARVYSSAERKAVETAAIIAGTSGVPVFELPRTHENDRSATGFLPPDEFEAVADAFFASPSESVRGWERAADAQARIVAETADAIHQALVQDILMVGHGAVGTLLYCHLAGLAISRRHDQPAGGGNLFAYQPAARRMLHPWKPVETLA
ncbi:MAG TPA: histidine phosphatase family protein [Hyphomonas sp.]|nr:histidine phosphatase family protein [Hyphomonas sp.]MCA8904118.1 histidine phosphatase family protein [Hyphomonas sp.]MCB9970612.1 histidine phosphatase family protein [Hyphomonas sp.]HPE47304.1 histidine phosphatase family protein [Hyphomonas sp.]